MRPTPLDAAAAFKDRHHPEAAAALLAGSVIRGEATATSDLDIVVLYRQLPHPYRTSHDFQGWPIEAFVHDPGTLAWFYEIGRADVPSLQSMVAEGIPVGVSPEDAAWVAALQEEARRLRAAGPPAWSDDDLRLARYGLTDLADDLRAPRNPAELSAVAARAYPALATFWLRTRGHWGASGKSIPRALERLDPAFASRFLEAFAAAHAGEGADLVALIDDLLAPHGGRLFDGYHLPAPAAWRLPPTEHRLQLVTLRVRDYDAAIRFFVDVLGFRLTTDEPSRTHDGRPKRWVVVTPGDGGTGLLLAQVSGSGADGSQTAGRVGFFLRVSDFDGMTQRMLAAGVVFHGVPRDEAYGRVVVFEDLEGNRWDLLGPSS